MKRLQKSAVDITPVDITHNLESLQFESALNEDEKQLLVLRKRSHAMVVTSCTQATFFANLLHEARCVRVPPSLSVCLVSLSLSHNSIHNHVYARTMMFF